MRKMAISLLVLLAAAVMTAVPVFADWSEKVTGGGQATAGGVSFSIAASAWDDGDANAGGMFQYSRDDGALPPLYFHATVEKMDLRSDGTTGAAIAVMAGPVKEQYDPGNYFGEGDWAILQIKEGGIGSGDTFRVWKASAADAQSYVDNPTMLSSWPGSIVDGNFNIREK